MEASKIEHHDAARAVEYQVAVCDGSHKDIYFVYDYFDVSEEKFNEILNLPEREARWECEEIGCSPQDDNGDYIALFRNGAVVREIF